MTITVIRYSIRNRGGDRLVLDYLSHCLRQGHEIVYWTNKIDTVFFVDPRLHIKKIPLPGRAGAIIFTLLKKFSSSIVLVDLVVMAYLASVRNRGRVLYLAQGFDVTYYRLPLLKRVIEFLYCQVLHNLNIQTISVSDGLTSRLNKYRPKNLITIPNGVDLDFFYRDYKLSKEGGRHIILFFARSEYFKGLDIAIKAIKKLQEIHPAGGWEVWTIGRESIDIPGTTIRNLGFIKSDEQLRDVLSSATVYMVSSRSEGLSLLLLQALACQCVVVSTAASSILTHEVNGLISPIGDPLALAENLKRALEEPQLMERLKREARILAEQYSLKRSCNDFGKILLTCALP